MVTLYTEHFWIDSLAPKLPCTSLNLSCLSALAQRVAATAAFTFLNYYSTESMGLSSTAISLLGGLLYPPALFCSIYSVCRAGITLTTHLEDFKWFRAGKGASRALEETTLSTGKKHLERLEEDFKKGVGALLYKRLTSSSQRAWKNSSTQQIRLWSGGGNRVENQKTMREKGISNSQDVLIALHKISTSYEFTNYLYHRESLENTLFKNSGISTSDSSTLEARIHQLSTLALFVGTCQLLGTSLLRAVDVITTLTAERYHSKIDFLTKEVGLSYLTWGLKKHSQSSLWIETHRAVAIALPWLLPLKGGSDLLQIARKQGWKQSVERVPGFLASIAYSESIPEYALEALGSYVKSLGFFNSLENRVVGKYLLLSPLPLLITTKVLYLSCKKARPAHALQEAVNLCIPVALETFLLYPLMKWANEPVIRGWDMLGGITNLGWKKTIFNKIPNWFSDAKILSQ